MKNLLDTHTFIWYVNGNKELSGKAIAAIEETSAENFVSIASLWEIAIKISIGKLELHTPFEDIVKQMVNNNFQLLSIAFEDTLLLTSLPFHHRDPFDRILIAQSLNNGLGIISKDPMFSQYTANVLW
jgi:PIN domain nuclease of toxin-antitoxin system